MESATLGKEQNGLQMDNDNNANSSTTNSSTTALKGEDSAESNPIKSPSRSRKRANSTSLHPNNSSTVESAIQNFLASPTQIFVSGVSKQVTIRDRIRLLSQPFVPSEEGVFAKDPMTVFAELTPYATTDRHRRYTSDDTTSQHLDIQNCSRLEDTMKKFNIDSLASLFGSELHRKAIDRSSDYLAMRAKQNEDWAASSLATGRDLLKANNIDKASSAFTHALEIDPKCFPAMLELAKIYISKSEYDKALKACEKMLEIKETDDEAFYLLQKVLEKTGNREYRRSRFFQSIMSKRRAIPRERETTQSDRHSEREPIAPQYSRSRTRTRSQSREHKSSRSYDHNRRDSRRSSRETSPNSHRSSGGGGGRRDSYYPSHTSNNWRRRSRSRDRGHDDRRRRESYRRSRSRDRYYSSRSRDYDRPRSRSRSRDRYYNERSRSRDGRSSRNEYGRSSSRGRYRSRDNGRDRRRRSVSKEDRSYPPPPSQKENVYSQMDKKESLPPQSDAPPPVPANQDIQYD